jgi:hypothetical protein
MELTGPVPSVANGGVHIDNHRLHPPVEPGRRDRLAYRIMVSLGCTPDEHTTDLASLAPDCERSELRLAADWLVETGYARWCSGASIALTEHGRQAVGSVVDLTVGGGPRCSTVE